MKKISKVSYLLLSMFIITCMFSFTNVEKLAKNHWQGIASYYHQKFNGRLTSTGEIFSNKKLTAANNFLKLGTMVKVTNLLNGKSVIVKVNDRMNRKNKRLIDLSQAAAKELGLIQQGIGKVEMEVLSNLDDFLASR